MKGVRRDEIKCFERKKIYALRDSNTTASPFNKVYSYDALHNRTTLASMLDINQSEYVYDSQNRLVMARYN